MRVPRILPLLLALLGLVASVATVRSPLATNLFTRAPWSAVTLQAAEAAGQRPAPDDRHADLRLASVPVRSGVRRYEGTAGMKTPLGLIANSNLVTNDRILSGSATPLTEAGSLMIFGTVLIGAARIARRRLVPERTE